MSKMIDRVPDAFELMKYGYFYPWKYPRFTIDSGDAVSITAAQTSTYFSQYTQTAAHQTIEVDLSDIPGSQDWCAIIYRYAFGVSSSPDKLYYQIITYGQHVIPDQFKTGFVAGGYISDANLTIDCPLPPLDDRVEFQFWNTSSPAEDVWGELAVLWYFFPKENLDKVLALALPAIAASIGTGGNGQAPDMGMRLDRIIWLLEYMAKLRVKFERDLEQ